MQCFIPLLDIELNNVTLERFLRIRAVNSLFAETDNDAFCCSRSLEELRDLNHTGALAWIERFENGVNQTGKPLPEVLAKRVCIGMNERYKCLQI